MQHMLLIKFMCPSQHSSDYQKLFMHNLTGNSCKQPTGSQRGNLATWQHGHVAMWQCGSVATANWRCMADKDKAATTTSKSNQQSAPALHLLTEIPLWLIQLYNTLPLPAHLIMLPATSQLLLLLLLIAWLQLKRAQWHQHSLISRYI